MDINMFEITNKNCYKCDLETRDFEVETESKWLNIFNKHGNKLTLKYKRDITPDTKFQTDKNS